MKQRIQFLLPVVCLLFSSVFFSQEQQVEFPEQIVTDRPDQTEAPQLTPMGWFQVEAGIQSEFDEDKQSHNKAQNILYNTTLWKYGLSKNFELRLITEFAEERRWFQKAPNTSDTMVSQSGVYPITVGSKIFIHKQKGAIPDISLILHTGLAQTGSAEFKQQFSNPSFRFVFANELNKTFSFSYNLGAEWEEDSGAASGLYTASLCTRLGEKFSFFIEAYGFLKENETADHRADGGFVFLLTNNVQLDCSGGIGLSENSPDYFISAGLSFRLNAFDKENRKKN